MEAERERGTNDPSLEGTDTWSGRLATSQASPEAPGWLLPVEHWWEQVSLPGRRS